MGYVLTKSYPNDLTYSFYHRQHASQLIAGSHPDNPRPIEVHLGFKKSVWGYDLSEILWQEGRSIQLYEAHILVPSPIRFLLQVAVHASNHFLTQTGCWLHWLDAAQIIQKESNLNIKDPIIMASLPLVYPYLKLAKRVFPQKLAQLNLQEIEGQVAPYLQQWAKTVPLDDRCGLLLDMENPYNKPFWQRAWRRHQT